MLLLSVFLAVFGLSNNWSWNVPTESSTANYSLMTYNIRLFDWYNWLDGKSWDGWKARTDNGATLDSLYTLIKTQNTDFFCVQEFFNQSKGTYQTEKYLKSIGYQYAHIAYSTQKSPNYYGIATFSKYPIVGKQVKFFSSTGPNNGILITDVKIPGDTIRIINVHLESFRLKKKDYYYLNTLKDSSLESISAQPTIDLVDKIKLASERRSYQLSQLLDCIDFSPHPVILAGDFNELPNSYLYNEISKKLKDGFMESGWGLGATLVSELPGLRIDYTFYSRGIKPVKHQVIQKELSDHYPVLFEFKKLNLVQDNEAP